MTSFRVVRGLALFATLSVLGCGDSIAPDLAIAVAPVPHTANSGGPFILVTIHNVSGRAVQLAACDGTDILPLREQRVGGEWVASPLASCVKAFAPVSLAPGETVATAYWNFNGVVGTYRFRAPRYADSLSVEPSSETSNELTLP